MINLTDRLQCLAEGGELDAQIRDCLDGTGFLLAGTVGGPNPSGRDIFLRQFGPDNLKPAKLGDAFLQASLDLSQLGLNQGAAAMLSNLYAHTRQGLVSASTLAPVKRGLRLFLVELWQRGAVLLPSRFNAGAFFCFEVFDHELLKWLLSYMPTQTVQGRKDAGRRLSAYGPHLLWATDWRDPESVRLDEIASLHRAAILSRHGRHPHVVLGPAMPYLLFASELLKSFPGRVKYSESDLSEYSNLLAFHELRRTPRSAGTVPRFPSPLRKPEALVDSPPKTHEAVIQLVQKLGTHRPLRRWQDGAPLYVGREHVDTSSQSAIWVRTFKAYLANREVQGYRNDRDIVRSLNLLSEYLFFYLPWWKELHPASHISLPKAPREFTRYAFVARLEHEPVEQLPLTVLEVMRLRRRTAGSLDTALRQLCLYFGFVERMYHGDEEVAGVDFRSPLDMAFDAPRMASNSKTVKQVFPKATYAHLVAYCYAVEEFGRHLQQLASRGELPLKGTALTRAREYNCEQFGFHPEITTRQGTFRLDFVPNVFTWAEREDASKEGTKRRLLPHLTAHRLVTTFVDTGLRGQSAQWLDRRTWDSQNVPGSTQKSYALFVNTDKTKRAAWITCIMSRTREVLLREQQFQESHAEEKHEVPVLYEDKDSPFGTILPLFCRANDSKPIPDKAYYSAWKRLIIGFEGFFRRVSGHVDLQFYSIRPVQHQNGVPETRQTKRGHWYCPVTVETFYTPHSCRATFPSVRAGLLDAEDAAELLGHEDADTTRYYTKLTFEQLQEKLEASDADVFSRFIVTADGVEPIPVRADKSDSPLVRGFAQDRREAIEKFRFMPPVVFWALEDINLEQDGLELLRSGPMSRIVFHETHICPVGDECPVEVILIIGEPRRCGLCPLAMKCQAHLQAISAKRNHLLEVVNRTGFLGGFYT